MQLRTMMGVVGMMAAVIAVPALRAQDPQPTRSVWDGVYTEEQAKRGAVVNEHHCARCHGAELLGGEIAPALTGGTFAANWNGLTLGELLERIRITMPLDQPGTVSRQDNADVLAFMLMVNKFPSGAKDLPRQTEFLRQIRFSTKR
jgi:mono/diheme cytochrome c family protein